jgi:hypothetical protein
LAVNGKILKEHAPGLWTADGQADIAVPKFLRKYDFSTRMTVIRLADGGLFLHSPVRLTEGLRAEIDTIGPVRAIVAPNKTHHLFAGDACAAYPQARLYGALGLPEKRKDLRFAGVLGDDPWPEWRGVLEQRLVRGAPMLNEVAFFHPASRTLVLTDLAFNVPKGRTWGIPLVFLLMGAKGRFGPHRFVRWIIRDQLAARASLGFIMRWDFDRIIVAHGDVLESGGRQRLRDAYSFILGAASRSK